MKIRLIDRGVKLPYLFSSFGLNIVLVEVRIERLSSFGIYVSALERLQGLEA